MSSAPPTDFFENIREQLLSIDPVYFCETHLTLDGKPFRISGNGYKPFADIYRYIGVKALEKSGKPIVICKSRQVGGTTMATALELFFMCCGHFGMGNRPAIRVLHAFPQLDLAFSYAKTKLNTTISSSLPMVAGKINKSYLQSLLDQSNPTNDSLQFKQFNGGNHIWIESLGLDGNRTRGKTVDALFVDEVQLVPGAAINNALKILTKAQYGPVGQGVQCFFGTPLGKGSEFHHMWEKSSQQYYNLHCEKCEGYFPLHTPDSDKWEEIWISDFTVKCTHCGHLQNKIKAAESGKWIATRNPDECDFVGFHINQLYMPEFSKERMMAEKPGRSPTATERSWQNEVLGEFFSGEAGIITPDQIRELCGDTGRKFRASISPGQAPFVVMGIDIGAKADLEQIADTESKKQGQSYSCLTVLSVTAKDRLSLEFATKFKRNDFASKKQLIDQVMRKYSVNLAICDLGYAGDLNEIMQNEYGERFLASQASGKVNEHIKYSQEIFPKVVLFERDYYIGELFDQMKKGNIRFPYGDYEQLAWLVNHCTSMEIKPKMNSAGNITPHYTKGVTPNDGFMALLNAYLAYKFYITSGFTIKNPMNFNDPLDIKSKNGENKILAVTGYIPKLR
jgi:hypothetical protein